MLPYHPKIHLHPHLPHKLHVPSLQPSQSTSQPLSGLVQSGLFTPQQAQQCAFLFPPQQNSQQPTVVSSSSSGSGNNGVATGATGLAAVKGATVALGPVGWLILGVVGVCAIGAAIDASKK